MTPARAGLSFGILSLHHDLLTVGGDVIVERLKARHQRLGTSGFDVRYPYFTRLSLTWEIIWRLLHDPIAQLSTIRREFGLAALPSSEIWRSPLAS